METKFSYGPRSPTILATANDRNDHDRWDRIRVHLRDCSDREQSSAIATIYWKLPVHRLQRSQRFQPSYRNHCTAIGTSNRTCASCNLTIPTIIWNQSTAIVTIPAIECFQRYTCLSILLATFNDQVRGTCVPARAFQARLAR